MTVVEVSAVVALVVMTATLLTSTPVFFHPENRALGALLFRTSQRSREGVTQRRFRPEKCFGRVHFLLCPPWKSALELQENLVPNFCIGRDMLPSISRITCD